MESPDIPGRFRALAVTFTTNLTSHHYWNIGIKIGTTLHTLTIRIT